MDIIRILEYLNFNDLGEQPAPDCSTYNTMVATWRHPNKQPPTEQQMADAWVLIQTVDNAAAYKQKRAAEYPAVGDMIDAMAKALEGDASEFSILQAKRTAIKIKYPKPA